MNSLDCINAWASRVQTLTGIADGLAASCFGFVQSRRSVGACIWALIRDFKLFNWLEHDLVELRRVRLHHLLRLNLTRAFGFKLFVPELLLLTQPVFFPLLLHLLLLCAYDVLAVEAAFDGTVALV